MGWKIAIVLFLLMGILGVVAYFTFQKQEAQIEEQRRVIAAQELADKTQKDTIAQLQYNLELQTTALNDLTKANQSIQEDMNRYLDIFKRHDLGKLAAAKPGLLEPRVNRATKEVFDAIEADSRALSESPAPTNTPTTK
jgi:lipopolysaccharide export LptBFGC system permease protein LptF